MTDPEAALEPTSPDEAADRLLQRWHDGTPGQQWTHLVDGDGLGDGRTVLDRVHDGVPDSVLLDVTGLTCEAVLRRVSELVGVDPGAAGGSNWLRDMRKLTGRRLVLLSCVHRMGGTRRSYEPERLLRGILPALCTPEGLHVVAQLRTTVLLEPSGTGLQVTGTGMGTGQPRQGIPEALRALALAEARVVPLDLWAELALALGLEDQDQEALSRLVEQSPQWFAVHESGVAFADEGLAEAIREQTEPEVVTGVGERMLDRLRALAPQLRHAEGWPAAGPSGSTPPPHWPCTPSRPAASRNSSPTAALWRTSRRPR